MTGATRTIPGGAVASQEDIKGDLIAMIEQSAARLDTVVGNLLINARTYAPDSKVLLTGGAVQDCVEIRVIDHGPGIPEEKIDDIFVPFQRLNDTGASSLGLGIPVAKGFVEEMGGRLEHEPTPTGGATFVLTLKAAKHQPVIPQE